MTLLNTLQSSGITIGMVQLAIIAGIVVYIIGTYWKVLLTGAGIITVAIILLYSESDGNKPTEVNNTPTTVETTTNASIAPVPTPVSILKVIPTVPDAFMEDCMKDAEYTKEECEKIWTNP